MCMKKNSTKFDLFLQHLLVKEDTRHVRLCNDLKKRSSPLCFIACDSNFSAFKKQTGSKVLNIHKLFLSNRGGIGCDNHPLLSVIFRCRIRYEDDTAVAKLCEFITYREWAERVAVTPGWVSLKNI